MDEVITVLGGIILGIGSVFAIVCMGALMGGIAGWVVGFVFDGSIAALKAFVGIEATNFQLGAMLGFVGGFFRTSVIKTPA